MLRLPEAMLVRVTTRHRVQLRARGGATVCEGERESGDHGGGRSVGGHRALPSFLFAFSLKRGITSEYSFSR